MSTSVTTKVQVYDPAMCCSTGVCGPRVDPVLPRFASDLAALQERGVSVERYIGEVEQLSSRFSLLPWSSVEPTGKAGLAALMRGQKGEAPVAVS